MGDIAEGMINGDFDYVTGEYLGEGGGFPRTEQNRRKTNRNVYFEKGKALKFKRIRYPYQPIQGEVKGVLFYLGSYSEINGEFNKALDIVNRFCNERGYDQPKTKKKVKYVFPLKCIFIQKRFSDFQEWCLNNLQR